ncbi:MAG: hypothetical protein IIB36_02735 [Gemmatimonadetes bacterium]|nr:hypothetical protein [Gemmatimonadota bacterium]
MKEHELAVVDGNSTLPEATERPEIARTLADWEPTPRVITQEEEELLDSVTVSPAASVYLKALIGHREQYCRVLSHRDRPVDTAEMEKEGCAVCSDPGRHQGGDRRALERGR